MSLPLLTRAQSRLVDSIVESELGLPGLVLMENAGLLGALALLPTLASEQRRPVILVGAGNNGGDGYALGRQLLVRGVEPLMIALRPCHQLSPDAAVQRRACEALQMHIEDCPEPEGLVRVLTAVGPKGLLVDAVLGTGFEGVLRGDVAAWLECAGNIAQGVSWPCWAVDLPSGMDADLGSGAVIQAHHTLTLAAPKVGFETEAGRAACGQVQVLPIGVPEQILQRAAKSPT